MPVFVTQSSMRESENLEKISPNDDMDTSIQHANPSEDVTSFSDAQFPDLPDYSELQKIGAGAQGTMYRAKAPDGKWVAIKVLDFKQITDIKTIELFEREIETLKSLHIKGVPEFIKVIKTESVFYLVEEYIDAPSLSSRIKSHEHFAFAQILEIMTNALRILERLGQLVPPVVHRDIKPDNLLVDDQMNVYLVDFGTVAIQRQTFAASMTFAGTAGYLAPEQLYTNASPAADIYSLGMTILHLATGVSPCDMINEDLIPDVDKYIPDNIPKWFADILKQMTAPQLSKRVKSATDVLAAIHTHNETSNDLNATTTQLNTTTLDNPSEESSLSASRVPLYYKYATFDTYISEFKDCLLWMPAVTLLVLIPVFLIIILIGYLMILPSFLIFFLNLLLQL